MVFLTRVFCSWLKGFNSVLTYCLLYMINCRTKQKKCSSCNPKRSQCSSWFSDSEMNTCRYLLSSYFITTAAAWRLLLYVWQKGHSIKAANTNLISRCSWQVHLWAQQQDAVNLVTLLRSWRCAACHCSLLVWKIYNPHVECGQQNDKNPQCLASKSVWANASSCNCFTKKNHLGFGVTPCLVCDVPKWSLGFGSKNKVSLVFWSKKFFIFGQEGGRSAYPSENMHCYQLLYSQTAKSHCR